MQRITTTYIWTLLIVLLSSTTTLYASHILGGDISYTAQSNNVYTVKIRLYSDCSGIPGPSTLPIIISSASCNTTLFENFSNTGVEEASNYCVSGQTTTCVGGTLPGINVYTYEKEITLPSDCPDWIIRRDDCCRPTNITNLASPGSQTMWLEAELDNSSGLQNSSPAWNSIPSPYACIGTAITIENSANDLDGDSLVYSLVSARGASGNPLSYNIPFTATNPFSSSTAITIDPDNGSLSFSPSMTEISVVAIRLDEYRGGVKISSVNRDFILSTSTTWCSFFNSNAVPVFKDSLQNISGSWGYDNGIVSVCPGDSIDFDIEATDIDLGDTVFLSHNIQNDLPGAIVSVNSGTNPASLHVSWTPNNSHIGLKSFSAWASDQNCNTYHEANASFTIKVRGTRIVSKDTVICSLGDSLRMFAVGGSTFNWTPSAGLSSATSSSPYAFPVTNTTYVVTSNEVCSNLDSFSILIGLGSVSIVQGDTALICKDSSILLSTNQATATYNWSTGASSSSISVSAAGTYSVTVSDGSCSLNDEIYIGVDSSCVWPGDANYDGVVDALDILALGASWNLTGAVRPNASLSYAAQACSDWSTTNTIASVNNKHSDCDGNGVISLADTNAISLNYGLTHNKTGGVNCSNPQDVSLRLAINQSSVPSDGELIVDVLIGRDTLPMTNLYGIAFEMQVDNSNIDMDKGVNYDFSGSLLDSDVTNSVNFKKSFALSNKIDFGLTRSTKTNIGGFGKLGSVAFSMKDNISGGERTFEFDFIDVTALDVNGNPINLCVEGISKKVVVTGISEMKLEQINIYPNPVNEYLRIESEELIKKIKIMDLQGRTILEKDPEVKDYRIYLGGVNPGSYFIEVVGSTSKVVKKIVVK